jgi:hypothetical protein
MRTIELALEVERACMAADERLWAREYAKREAESVLPDWPAEGGGTDG